MGWPTFCCNSGLKILHSFLFKIFKSEQKSTFNKKWALRSVSRGKPIQHPLKQIDNKAGTSKQGQ